jgi:hypothetical protein
MIMAAAWLPPGDTVFGADIPQRARNASSAPMNAFGTAQASRAVLTFLAECCVHWPGWGP